VLLGPETIEEQVMTTTQKNVSDTIDQTTDAAREGVRAATNDAQDATVIGLDSVRRMTDQFTRAFSLSGQENRALMGQASENLGALLETSAVLTRGMQDVSHKWLSLSQHGLQKNIEGLTQLARCRSMQDLVAVQSELMRNNWHYMIDVSRQIAERSIEIANEATQKISAETKQATGRTRKAA
jgi:hypothetical protein